MQFHQQNFFHKTIHYIYYTLLCYTLLLIPATADETGYRLGYGLKMGTMPLYLGGYLSVEYEDIDEGTKSVTFDEFSVMLYGETERWNYMVEMEANDIYSEPLNAPDVNESVDFHLHLERLYLDYKQENYTLRVGKFNSLIGLWNRMPINVLRDTTSSPQIVHMLFPHFTTGVNIAYHPMAWGDGVVNVMLQETQDLDAYVSQSVYNNMEINRHYGVGVEMASDMVAYRLNMGTFRRRDDVVRDYLVGAVRYEADRWRLQGEVGTQYGDGGWTIPYVGYLQGTYTIAQGHEVVLRVESYKDSEQNRRDTFGVVGYTWRPLPAVALKGEYQHHHLLFSFSMLF